MRRLHWYFMRGQDYLTLNGQNECMMLVYEELASLEGNYSILMGDPFLRNYYSIYDMSNMRVGLIPLHKEIIELELE